MVGGGGRPERKAVSARVWRMGPPEQWVPLYCQAQGEGVRVLGLKLDGD